LRDNDNTNVYLIVFSMNYPNHLLWLIENLSLHHTTCLDLSTCMSLAAPRNNLNSRELYMRSVPFLGPLLNAHDAYEQQQSSVVNTLNALKDSHQLGQNALARCWTQPSIEKVTQLLEPWRQEEILRQRIQTILALGMCAWSIYHFVCFIRKGMYRYNPVPATLFAPLRLPR
jgi:hypothetical protein